jgi:hypothetical protein
MPKRKYKNKAKGKARVKLVDESTRNPRDRTARNPRNITKIDRSRETRRLATNAVTRFQDEISKESDHEAVYSIYQLLINGGIDINVFSYNISFASDLGLKRPFGTEAFFLSSNTSSDKRLYWKNAVEFVCKWFRRTKGGQVAYFQEMNDRKQVAQNDNGTFVDGKFEGGYQALLEILSAKLGESINYDNGGKEIQAQLAESYYKSGSFGKYRFVAYSLKKGYGANVVYPTLLTIWDSEVLGELDKFYGHDLGQHGEYDNDNEDYGNIHHGRNISCVRTTFGANLVNLHAPNNDEETSAESLHSAIVDNLNKAKKTFTDTWDPQTTIIGGDTNDGEDRLQSITFNGETYIYMGTAPKTCCHDYNSIRLIDYKRAGDKFYGSVPKRPIKIFRPFQRGGSYTNKNSKNSKALTRKLLKKR